MRPTDRGEAHNWKKVCSYPVKGLFCLYKNKRGGGGLCKWEHKLTLTTVAILVELKALRTIALVHAVVQLIAELFTRTALPASSCNGKEKRRQKSWGLVFIVFLLCFMKTFCSIFFLTIRITEVLLLNCMDNVVVQVGLSVIGCQPVFLRQNVVIKWKRWKSLNDNVAMNVQGI